MIQDILFGIVVGAGVVGSSIHRTHSAGRGIHWETAVACLLNSIFYYTSIFFVIKYNIPSIVGTAMGSLLVCAFITEQNKKRKAKKREYYERQKRKKIRSR